MWDEIIRDIAERTADSGQLPRPTPELLDEVWPTLIGSSLARQTSPVALNEGILQMEVRDRQLIDEWKSHPHRLLRRLRRFSPWSIDDVKFVHNPGLTSPESTSPHTASSNRQDSPQPHEDDPERASLSDDRGNQDDIDDPRLQALIDSIGRHIDDGEQ